MLCFVSIGGAQFDLKSSVRSIYGRSSYTSQRKLGVLNKYLSKIPMLYPVSLPLRPMLQTSTDENPVIVKGCICMLRLNIYIRCPMTQESVLDIEKKYVQENNLPAVSFQGAPLLARRFQDPSGKPDRTPSTARSLTRWHVARPPETPSNAMRYAPRPATRGLEPDVPEAEVYQTTKVSIRSTRRDLWGLPILPDRK